MDRVSRRRALALGGTTLATLVAGCSDGDDGNGADGEQRIGMTDDLAYEPDAVTVSSGTTVVWENDGSVAHTVTAYGEEIPSAADYFASGGFDSESAARDDLQAGLIDDGETFEHTFETTGEYEYFCIPHESADMIGSITVE